MKVSSRVIKVALSATLAIGGITGAIVGAAPSALAASSADCHFTSAQPELKDGSRGAAVMQAQCELNFAWVAQFHNGNLTEDGIFGSKTLSATELFQFCAGIAQDGIIGPQTWTMLNFYTLHGPCIPQTTIPQSTR
jgi:peptidoglycan hydrolase-like protein with peptidoglycan-binding domain